MARTFKSSGKLDLNTNSFETKINTVSKKLGNMARTGQKAFKGLGKSATGVGLDLMGLTAAPLTGALLGFKQLVDTGGNLKDLSGQLGVTTAALSELQYAGSLSGITMEDFTKSFQIMEKNMGSGKSADAMKTLGLDPKSLKEAAPDKAFESIIDALGKVKNQSERMNLAQQIFGKSGGSFLRLVEGGAKGIQELRAEAQKMGLSINNDTANKLDDLGDNWDKLNARVQGFKNTLALQLAPSLTELMDHLSNAAVSLGEFVNKHPELVKWVSLGGTAVSALGFAVGVAAFSFGRLFSLMSGGFNTLKTIFGWINKITAVKKIETAAIIADTVATEANTAAKTANAAAGGGGGALSGLGKAGLIAGAAYGGWQAGRWIDKKTEGTWFGKSVDWLSDKAVGTTNWVTGSNKPQAELGERAKQLMAQGKAGSTSGGSTVDQENKRLMEQQNKKLEEMNRHLAQIAANGSGNQAFGKLAVNSF